MVQKVGNHSARAPLLTLTQGLLSNLFFFKAFFFLKKKKKFYVFIFLRDEGREKERERNIIVWLPLVRLLLGTWPATQACALTGSRTTNPLVHSPYSIH